MRRVKFAKNVDISAVLQRLEIDVRKTVGREIWAPCPLHSIEGLPERTPSFRIRNDPDSEKHGFYQCFGSCQGDRRSGSVFKLVQLLLELENRSDARRWISGEELQREREQPSRIVIEESIPKVVKRGVVQPIGVSVLPVAKWPQMAREYLTNARGIPVEQAEKWGVGFGKFGRYAHRIYFPAFNRQGQLLNFTTRTYVDAVPKFKEPHEHSGAEKSAVFGEVFWPDNDKRDVIVVLESAINALAAEREVPEFQRGSIFGSEVLPGHFLRFGTFKTALVASDPDPAGDKFFDAMYRGLARHARVERVQIPDGTDAADLAKESPGILRQRILDAARRAGIDRL
jgi:hypothetical protein